MMFWIAQAAIFLVFSVLSIWSYRDKAEDVSSGKARQELALFHALIFLVYIGIHNTFLWYHG